MTEPNNSFQSWIWFYNFHVTKSCTKIKKYGQNLPIFSSLVNVLFVIFEWRPLHWIKVPHSFSWNEGTLYEDHFESEGHFMVCHFVENPLRGNSISWNHTNFKAKKFCFVFCSQIQVNRKMEISIFKN